MIDIDLTIRDKKYLTSKYNDNVIDPELSTYIMNYMIGNNLDDKVTISIKSSIEFSNKEKEKYIDIIRKEFKENIVDINDEILGANVRKVILSLVGLAFIAISYLFNSSLGEVISQVFVVFGWVALWEVGGGLLFNDARRKKALKRYKQLLNAEIIFK